MRKFWGLYDNGTYRVACNGASIYIYNSRHDELKRFQDIRYAYYGSFQPGSNRFVAKSTDGKMAVYDLDRMELMKKFTVSRVSAQDEGFAFTPDGRYFYNLESMDDAVSDRLAIYRSTDFELCASCFDDEQNLLLHEVEFDENSGECYLFGYHRYEMDGYRFIGRFKDGKIMNEKRLDTNHGDWLLAYTRYRRSGFTENRYKSWQFTLQGDVRETSLKREYEKLA